MAYQWTTSAKLENRLGPALYRRLYDDDGDGSVDTGTGEPVDQLIEEASGVVAGYLRGNYNLAAVDAAVTAGSLNEVQRLTLDVAEARAVRRFPETARHKDPDALWQMVRTDLVDLRKGNVRLDVEGTPEPPTNQGGAWGQGDPDLFDSSDPPETFTRDGFGGF